MHDKLLISRDKSQAIASILIDRRFHGCHWPIILLRQLKEQFCRAWLGCSPRGFTPLDEYAIQTTSCAALNDFPMRQFVGNRWDNTQQNGEHSFVRVVRFLLSLLSLLVPWLGYFCPQGYVSSMFLLGFSSPRWRSNSTNRKTDLDHVPGKSPQACSPVGKLCFGV